MPLLEVPAPDGWRDGRQTFLWVFLGSISVVALALGWAVFVLTRGEYLTTAIIFGVMAFPLAVLIALLLVSQGRTQLNATPDATGLTIRPDRRFSTLFLVGVIAFIPAGALFVYFVPAGQVSIPMSRGWQIFAPIGMGFGVVAAIVGLLSALRRGGIGYLKLTPAEIENGNIAFTKTLVWDDVVDIAATTDKKRTRKAVVLKLRDGSEEVIESADLYTPGGATLYWMLRHYWKHPEGRAELQDGRALRLLREESFDPN